MPLWELVQGAGLYQTFAQDHTPLRGLAEGAFNVQQPSESGVPGTWDLPDKDIQTRWQPWVPDP